MTDEKKSPTSHRQRVREILEEARSVLMFTRDAEGELHGRPMSIAKVTDEGTIFFSSSVDSLKVTELGKDKRVDLAFQSKTQYAHVRATGLVLDDRSLVHQLWQEDWKVWYPGGKDDPQIRIILVEPQSAEYWDLSGSKGLSFLYEAAKALVQGKSPEGDGEIHGRTRM